MKKFVSITAVAEINPKIPDVLDHQPAQSVNLISVSEVSKTGQINSVNEALAGSRVKGKDFRYFETGDVLFARISPSMENGKAVLVENLPHQMGFCSPEFYVLRPGSSIDGRYLFYMVWNPVFRQLAARNMTGVSGYQRVPQDFFKQAQIPLPSLNEQKRITTILDRAAAILQKRQDAISLTEEFLRATFLELFGDPVANWHGWRKISLDTLTPQKGQLVDGPYGSLLKPECYKKEGVRVVRYVNIKDDFFDESEFKYVSEQKFAEIKRNNIQPQDLLLCTKSTARNVCLMPNLKGKSVLSTSGIVRIRLPRDSPVLPEFAVQQMSQKSYKQYIKLFESGSKQKYLNLSGIRKMELIAPPLELQHHFLELKIKHSSLKFKNHLSCIESENLFNSLLQQAFVGEL